MSSIVFFDTETTRSGDKILDIGGCMDDGQQYIWIEIKGVDVTEIVDYH